jgi:hypothetical protein
MMKRKGDKREILKANIKDISMSMNSIQTHKKNLAFNVELCKSHSVFKSTIKLSS